MERAWSPLSKRNLGNFATPEEGVRVRAWDRKVE
jgi:hypothetical protein